VTQPSRISINDHPRRSATGIFPEIARDAAHRTYTIEPLAFGRGALWCCCRSIRQIKGDRGLGASASAIAALGELWIKHRYNCTMRRGLLMSNQLTACQYFRSAGQPRPSTRENWQRLVGCWRFRYHPRAPIIEALQADSEGPFSRTLEHFTAARYGRGTFRCAPLPFIRTKINFPCGVAAFQFP
jgi:hypothetical protein